MKFLEKVNTVKFAKLDGLAILIQENQVNSKQEKSLISAKPKLLEVPLKKTRK